MKWSLHSAWLAMSARASKTSSRGRAIVISLLIGSTRPRSLRGGAYPQPNGVPALGVVHDLRALGRRAAPGAAQLAHDGAARVEVDPLAHERGSSAVRAVAASRFAGPHALAKKLALEVGLGDPEQGLQHGRGVRYRRSVSCARAPLERPLQPLVAGALTVARRSAIRDIAPVRLPLKARWASQIRWVGRIDSIVMIVGARGPKGPCWMERERNTWSHLR